MSPGTCDRRVAVCRGGAVRLLGGVGVSDAAGDSVFVTVENHWGGAQCLGVWRVGRGAPGSQGSCVCWASGGFLPCLRGNGLVRLGAAGPSAPGRKLGAGPFLWAPTSFLPDCWEALGGPGAGPTHPKPRGWRTCCSRCLTSGLLGSLQMWGDPIWYSYSYPTLWSRHALIFYVTCGTSCPTRHTWQ